MIKRKNKTLLIVSTVTISLTVLSASIGFSLASFERQQTVSDQTSGGNLLVTGEGRRKKAYFLDLNNIWNTSDGAEFWAIAFDSNYAGDRTTAEGLKTFAWTKGTLSGNNYEFFVDRVKYDYLVFVRYNGSQSDPAAFANKAYNASGVYNITTDLLLPAENSTNFTFRISNWHQDGVNYSPGYWY